MAFKWLLPENIRVDWNLNPRERDDDHIRTIASHMNEKGYDAKFPIVVYRITTGSMAIKDTKGDDVFHAATGHHRLGASMLQDDEFPNLPLSEVYCEVREGTRSEYIRWMLIDNFQHTPGFNKNIGKMPTRKELQQMRFQLLYFPDVFAKGDRLLATEWGCDHKTVGEVRSWFTAKLSDGENSPPDHVPDSDIEKIKAIIESDLYLGKDGKKYPRTAKQESSTPTHARKYYAQIVHHNRDDAPYSNMNELYFPIKEQRDGFVQEFREYHGSHEHAGLPPEIKIVKSSELSTGEREQAKQMIDKDKVGWGTDYDGWYEPELEAKIRYFKPTCIIQETPAPEESQDEELDADLKKKLTDIFTLHGSIPIYNPSTQKSYSEELAQDSSLSAAEVYLQINQFKTYIHELEKEIKKSLKKDPSWKYDSLACAMNLMQEEAGIVKTIMANIESHQQFLDKHPQGKPEKRLLRKETPASEAVETEVPVEFEIDELDITVRTFKNGDTKVYGDPNEADVFIFINNESANVKISDLPEPLMAELTEFVKSHLEKNEN